MEKQRYISPYTDFGFKYIFGSELNKEYLISFLNALFIGLLFGETYIFVLIVLRMIGQFGGR